MGKRPDDKRPPSLEGQLRGNATPLLRPGEHAPGESPNDVPIVLANPKGSFYDEGLVRSRGARRLGAVLLIASVVGLLAAGAYLFLVR